MPKATKEPKEDPKAKEDPKHKEADKEIARAEEEAECLEYYEDREGEGGSSTISDPAFGSTGTNFDTVNVDCEAIANDEGPTDGNSVSFSVNFDVLKDADSKMSNIYAAMEEELQQKVAPRIAGCSSGRRLSGEELSKIVHVDFGKLEFDHQGECRFVSSLRKPSPAATVTHLLCCEVKE